MMKGNPLDGVKFKTGEAYVLPCKAYDTLIEVNVVMRMVQSFLDSEGGSFHGMSEDNRAGLYYVMKRFMDVMDDEVISKSAWLCSGSIAPYLERECV